MSTIAANQHSTSTLSSVIRLTNHLTSLLEKKKWGRPELPLGIHQLATFDPEPVSVSPHISIYNATFESGSVIWTVYVGSDDYLKCTNWVSKKLQGCHLALYAEIRRPKYLTQYQHEVKVWGLNEVYLAQLIEYDNIRHQAEEELKTQALNSEGQYEDSVPSTPTTIHPEGIPALESEQTTTQKKRTERKKSEVKTKDGAKSTTRKRSTTKRKTTANE